MRIDGQPVPEPLVDAMAEDLEVSRRSLELRMTELGLTDDE